MPDNKPFKLGELTQPEVQPFVSPLAPRTSTGSGNALNKELDDLFNKPKVRSGERRPQEKADFGKAFESATEGLKGTGHGALAAIGTTLGFDEFADAEIKASERNQRKADRLARGLIMDAGDIEFNKGIVEGSGDLANYLINGAGTVAPSILETIAAGVAGAAIGSVAPGAGTVGGALVGAGAKVLGKKKLQSLVKEYVTSNGFKQVAGQSAKRAALNSRKKKIVEDSISKFYQTAGVMASGQALGTGEIFNEALGAGATKDEAATFGLIGGVPFAALDAVLPASIIKQIGSKAVKGRVASAVGEGVEGFVKEGLTETAQEELLIRTKKNFDQDFDTGGQEASSRRLNSFILGGFAGGVLGGVSGAAQSQQVATKDLTTPLTNVDFSNKEVASAYSRLLSFKNTNERFTGLIDSDKDQEVVDRVLNQSDTNISNLRKDLQSKFLSEENKDTASRAEAKEVIEAIDAHIQNQDKIKQEAKEVVARDEKLAKAQKNKSEQAAINPEFKHTEGIQESVLGIAESLDIKLNKGQLANLTDVVQQRMFKVEDQTQSAEDLLDRLTPFIEQDIHETNRAKETDSEFDAVAKKQRAARGTTRQKRDEDGGLGRVPERDGAQEATPQAQEASIATASKKSSDSVKDQLRAMIDEESTQELTAEEAVTEISKMTPEQLKQAQDESIIATEESISTPKDKVAAVETKVVPRAASTKKAPKVPKKVPVKRAKKTIKDVDIGSVGTIDGTSFSTLGKTTGAKKGKVNVIPGRVVQEKSVRVEVSKVFPNGDVQVTTEAIGGNNFSFRISSNKLTTEKAVPSLDEQNANKIALEDDVKEGRNQNTKTNSKVIVEAKPKPKKVTPKAVETTPTEDMEDELDAIVKRSENKKATNEELARGLELETQLEKDKEDVLSVTEAVNQATKSDILESEGPTDEDVELEQVLKAVDKDTAKKNKVAKATQLTEEEIAQIESIQAEITELTDAKALLKDEGDLEGARDIQQEITALAKQKNDIKGVNVEENIKISQISQKLERAREEGKLTKEREDDVSTLSLDSTITEDATGHSITLNDNIITIQGKQYKVIARSQDTNSPEYKTTQDMVKRVQSGLRSQIGTDEDAVLIKTANSFKEYVKIMTEFGAKPSHIADEKGFDGFRGVAVTNSNGDKMALLNLTNHQMHIPEIASQTLMHELVGHIGLSRVFGDKLKVFTLGLLKSNPALRNDILNLSTRWELYVSRFAADNPTINLNSGNSFTFKNPKTGKVVLIHESTAALLGEEYMAELSAIKMADKGFKVSANIREGFLKNIFRRLVHLSRSLFGKFGSGINESDMLAAVAASADALFSSPDTDFNEGMRPKVLNHFLAQRATGIGLTPQGKLFSSRNGEFGIEQTVPEASLESLSDLDEATLDVIDLVDLNNQLTKEERAFFDRVEDTELMMDPSEDLDGKSAAEAMGANSLMTEGVVRAQHDRYGKLNESSKVKWLNDVGRSIRNNSMAQKFFALGNLPYVETYNGIQAITKGKLGKMEALSKRVNKQLGKLSAFQKEQVYKFFTNKFTEVQTNTEIDQLRSHGIPPVTLNTILEAKGTIESIGQQLVDLNMLNPKSFEENRGSYLPRRYLKYLFSNPGGGKKVSLLNFLKADKNLDEDTRAMLGEIKDPAFLVAETIGMIGRDTSILQMFDSLAENGRTGATSWVLNSEDFTTFRGNGVTQAWLAEEISRVEQILGDSREDSTGAFQLTPDQLAFNEATLRDLKSSEAEGEAAILERMRKESIENGQEHLSPSEYQSKHYKQMKVGKRMGKLSGLWVRKEIFNDLEGVLQSFDIDKDDPLTKFFGNRGALVQLNTHWKMLKVPFNLPSWFRNSVGNMTLLDMSTNTNSVALTKMLTEEIFNASGKKESKFWKMAVDNGLFGTTYAAAELYGMRTKMERQLKVTGKADKLTAKSKLKGMFSFMQGGYLGLTEIASQGFGLVEGSFKTVAMRDFIQTWQKENDVANIDSLEQDKRQAVILEAVAHANNALFDYSQVPPLVNILRRYPLGAPFITFMYKSFPVVIESLAKRPQKFIKYAAFPAVMGMLAQGMNDWDDKDIERLQASLPQWTRDKSSVFLMPFKDSQGRPQFADYSYALPWSPFVDAAMKINNHFEANSIAGAVNSTLALGQDIGDDFGFLGGPTSTMITAWKSNKDSFTGRPIINEGDNPGKKMGDLLKWTWNMAAPSFITSHGFLGKTIDNLGIDFPGISEEPLDQFGQQKETAGQIAANLTGFGARGFDPRNSVQSNLKGYARRLIEIDKSKSKFLKDKNVRLNPQERASGLREFNTRRKLIIQERTDFLNKVRG